MRFQTRRSQVRLPAWAHSSLFPWLRHFTCITSHPGVKWIPGWTVIESRCTIVSSCAEELYALQYVEMANWCEQCR